MPPDKVVDVQALAGDFDRQRAGRAGHRRQDRGRADQRVRRSRHAAGARRRDQAAQAAREADRVRRAGAHLARAGAPQGRRAAGDRRSRRSACAIPMPTTLLGFLRAMEFNTLTQAHRREAWAPSRRRRSQLSVGVNADAAVATDAQRTGAPRRRRASRAPATPAAAVPPAPRRAAPKRHSTARKYETVTTRDAARSLDRARRARPAASPSTPRRRASIAMQRRARRLLAGGRAGRGLLRAARPPRRRGDFDFGDGDGLAAGPDRRSARRCLKPLLEDASVLKIGQNLKYDCARAGAARHRRSRRSTTPCCCPTRSTAAAAGTAWTSSPSATSGTPACPFDAGDRACAGRQEVRARPSRRCRSTRRPSTPPRTPTSRCGCGWR